ncbi:hypothetical protein WJX72_008697 [[Myrmecia] bisecta]|uniref:Uncharacterized protein n=1 Tax=[Myrmecia] bisecta TaxID=41462 RepID=A0AAW1PLV8_9CHLO
MSKLTRGVVVVTHTPSSTTGTPDRLQPDAVFRFPKAYGEAAARLSQKQQDLRAELLHHRSQQSPKAGKRQQEQQLQAGAQRDTSSGRPCQHASKATRAVVSNSGTDADAPPVFEAAAVEALLEELEERQKEAKRATLLMEAMKQEYMALILETGSRKAAKGSLAAAQASRLYGHATAKLTALSCNALPKGSCSRAQRRISAHHSIAAVAGMRTPPGSKPAANAKAQGRLHASKMPAGDSVTMSVLESENAWLAQQLKATQKAMAQLQTEHDDAQSAAERQCKEERPEIAAVRAELELAKHRQRTAEHQAADAAAQLADKGCQIQSWAEAAEKEAAEVASVSARLDEERRRRQELESRVEVLQASRKENERLAARLHALQTELISLEKSRGAARDELEVMRCQVRELESILDDRHADINNLHGELSSMRVRLLEAERASEQGAHEHSKLQRLESCTEKLLQTMQREQQKAVADNTELNSLNSALRSQLAAERQRAAMLSAQLQLTEQQGKSHEEALLNQLKGTQEERNACLAAATRADTLIARLGLDRYVSSPTQTPSKSLAPFTFSKRTQLDLCAAANTSKGVSAFND